MATLSSLLGSNFVGDTGPSGEISVANTVVVNPNVDPSVADLTSSNTSLFTAQFSLPRAPDISIGTVSLGSNTTNAAVTNTGSNGDATLNFTIPRAANVSIGTVTTGAAGSSAAVTNGGSNGDVVLNFTIPRGDTGIGDVTGPASATDNAIVRFDGITGKLVQNSTVTIDDAGLLTANSYTIRDARNDGDITPANFPDKSVTFNFTDDITGSTENWDSVITMKGWTDTYQAWQLIASSNESASDTNLYYRTGVNSTWGSKQKIWTDANDGSGSGLDADTLDSLHASSFARVDTATRQDFTGSIRVSTNNTTGGGIVLADDGDIVDLNDGYASMRFSQGVRIYSTNGGGSVVHTLAQNGNLTSTGTITAAAFSGDGSALTNLPSSGVTTGKAIAMAIVFG
jgi:hypothetical protein